MMSAGDAELIASIDRHINRHVAPEERVYHEIVSDELHIDIHHVPPAWNRRFHALITSGMSALPMHASSDAMEWRFAELCILLEPSWRLGPDAFEDERWYWPVRLLKILARYPRDYSTWLGYPDGCARHGGDIRCRAPRSCFRSAVEDAQKMVAIRRLS